MTKNKKINKSKSHRHAVPPASLLYGFCHRVILAQETPELALTSDLDLHIWRKNSAIPLKDTRDSGLLSLAEEHSVAILRTELPRVTGFNEQIDVF